MAHCSHRVHGARRIIVLCLVFLVVAISFYRIWDRVSVSTPRPVVTFVTGPVAHHPIDDLIANASSTFRSIISKQTTSLPETAKAYRERRGRHPPPGFDAWYAFASANNAFIVEDFFDRIYGDLRPFWGISAKKIRGQAGKLSYRLIVRNGRVRHDDHKRQRLDAWMDMVEKIEHLLPDMDIPLNMLDEPKVAVSWEDIAQYVAAEAESRELTAVDEVIRNFTDLDFDKNVPGIKGPDYSDDGHFWDKIRASCAPGTPSRNESARTEFPGPPQFCASDKCAANISLPFTYEGFVSNWTRVKDPCFQPELVASHGAIIAPQSQSTTNILIPMFGGSKLSMNNDILIPAFSYWLPESDYTTGTSFGPPWREKSTTVTWRGMSNGGDNTPHNWARFHRHRFVALMNSSSVRLHSPTFDLAQYKGRLSAPAQSPLGLADWIDMISDVGFTHLSCYLPADRVRCPHMNHFYKVKKNMPMETQFYTKYLPDVDGNGFSGRYLAFLRSTSLPIKATIFSEWHDSRLVPWYHFVPMQNSFVDLYAILEYFVGFTKTDGVVMEAEKARDGRVLMEGGHDEQARRIAMQGKEWAEKVLRREDMLVYVLRLLLEYRRVCEDEREVMGWVGDLNGSADWK